VRDVDQHVDVHRPSRIRGVVRAARAAIEHDLEHAERRAAQPERIGRARRLKPRGEAADQGVDPVGDRDQRALGRRRQRPALAPGK